MHDHIREDERSLLSHPPDALVHLLEMGTGLQVDSYGNWTEYFDPETSVPLWVRGPVEVGDDAIVYHSTVSFNGKPYGPALPKSEGQCELGSKWVEEGLKRCEQYVAEVWKAGMQPSSPINLSLSTR